MLAQRIAEEIRPMRAGLEHPSHGEDIMATLLLSSNFDFGFRPISLDRPVMTVEERAKAIELLLESRDAFLEAVKDLTDAQWLFKPAPGQWSVSELAERIARSEDLIFDVAQRALAQKPDAEWASRTGGKNELVPRILLNRQHKARARGVIQP